MSLQWVFLVSQPTCAIVELLVLWGENKVLNAWCTVKRIIVID